MAAIRIYRSDGVLPALKSVDIQEEAVSLLLIRVSDFSETNWMMETDPQYVLLCERPGSIVDLGLPFLVDSVHLLLPPYPR